MPNNPPTGTNTKTKLELPREYPTMAQPVDKIHWVSYVASNKVEGSHIIKHESSR